MFARATLERNAVTEARGCEKLRQVRCTASAATGNCQRFSDVLCLRISQQGKGFVGVSAFSWSVLEADALSEELQLARLFPFFSGVN